MLHTLGYSMFCRCHQFCPYNNWVNGKDHLLGFFFPLSAQLQDLGLKVAPTIWLLAVLMSFQGRKYKNSGDLLVLRLYMRHLQRNVSSACMLP